MTDPSQSFKDNNGIRTSSLIIDVDNASYDQYISVEPKKPGKQSVDFSKEDEDFLSQVRRRQQQKQQNLRKLQERKKNKKPTVKQEPVKSQFELKKERIFCKVEQSVKRYQKLNYVTRSDSECVVFRGQQKQKLFKFLLFTLHELREIDSKDHSEEQSELMKLNALEEYTYTKALVCQIDTEFLVTLNNSNRLKTNEKFKEHWRELTHNLQDEYNLDLRRKIVTKKLTSSELANCSVKEFYSENRKKQIKRKEEILLLQSSKMEPIVMEAPKEEEIVIEYNSSFRNWQEEQKPTYSYVDISVISALKQLTSQGHITKMRSFITNQLKNESRERVLWNFNTTFG